MKFKKGDKVKIVRATVPKDERYINQIVTIEGPYTDECNDGRYAVVENNSPWVECELEFVGTISLNNLYFADILTLRNGERYVVVEEYMYGEDSGYYADCDDLLSCYNNDLTRNGDRDYDIMKVERAGQVIYEREEEVKEMTIAEISEKLGYEVKVVKEHE